MGGQSPHGWFWGAAGRSDAATSAEDGAECLREVFEARIRIGIRLSMVEPRHERGILRPGDRLHCELFPLRTADATPPGPNVDPFLAFMLSDISPTKTVS